MIWQKDHTQPRKRHWQQGGYAGKGTLNGKRMKAEAPAHKITNPGLTGAIAISKSIETPL